MNRMRITRPPGKKRRGLFEIVVHGTAFMAAAATKR
jgi:hypothetical protein